MAESAFSEDGKYFSTLSHDGRLRIWDTETNVLKQEYTPDLHLSSPPTCLLWFSIATSQTPRKGNRNSISEGESQCIALGTTNGKILVYSVTQAKIETVLYESKTSDVQENSITSLDWHRKYGLFSCSKGGALAEWDIKSGLCRYKYNILAESNNKQASCVNAIKIVPHNQNIPSKYLVTASWQLVVWRLQDGTASVAMTLGHSGAQKPLLNIAMWKQKCWLISGSQNERLLSFWDVSNLETAQQNGTDTPTPNKKQRRKSVSASPTVVNTPTYNFILEDAPKMVDVVLRDEDGSAKVELVAATRSGVVHYYGHTLNGASKKPIKPTVTIQVATEDARPVPLQSCKLAAQALVGYLDNARLIFERLTPDTSYKTQVLIRGGSKPQTNKQTDIINRTRTDMDDKVTYVEPLGGVARKRANAGGKIEVPMEARLENLSVDYKKRNKWAVSQNLTKLLIQGLHSQDKNLIHTVLQSNDPQVALRTVSSLPPHYVPLLLDQLAELATGKTSVCALVCSWLSALLQSQSAHLLASLGAQGGGKLAQLLAVFTQRRSHLCQLLNLKGRLDLTMAARTAPAKDLDQEAVLDYNDESSSDEMELHHSESESLDEFDSDKQENDQDEDMDDDDD